MCESSALEGALPTLRFEVFTGVDMAVAKYK